MSYALVIKEEARNDILKASQWYAEKGARLEIKFLNGLELILKSIVSNPKAYKKVYKNFRQASLNKFPYVLLYEHTAGSIVVFSIFHTSQHPSKKFKRFRD